ncbi:MAG: sensor histidine kinase [Oscillospiraceae bacterium]
MDKAIKRIRKKFITTATMISFSIIFLMVIILNLLMNLTYKNENQIIIDMISQTALLNAPSINSEKFYFKDMKPNHNGDYVITSVNVNDISKVILYGNISNNDNHSLWYCGGGGLMFNFQNANGEIILVHKEYIFNKDNTKITVDFSTFDDVMYNNDYITLKNGKILGDGLTISPVWWTSSSSNINDKNVSLNLDSIEIIYNDNVDSKNLSNGSIRYQNFNDVFGNDYPTVLNGVSSFYLITDSNYNLLEVNYGNLLTKISNEEALYYIDIISNSSKNSNTIYTKSGIPYNYIIKSKDDINVIMFTYNGLENITLKRLLIISIGVGIVLTIVLFIIIVIISKNVIKPIKIAFEKQKQFISNASHELKTPVTVISATTDLLKNQVGDNKWITCIKEQSEKMGRLIHELLDLAKISENVADHKNFFHFDISQVVNNSILYFECRTYEENKTIVTNIQKDITFFGDENRISELINILIDNALKYSIKNSEIYINLKTSKNRIILECSNQCDNLNTIDINRLFERFYRDDTSHSSIKSGFGLGLSIAQSIVEYHNGIIKASYNNNIIKFTVEFKLN